MKSSEQVNNCTVVPLILDMRVYPVDRIVHRLTPSCRLQGRLGGAVTRRRSADAQEDFHEQLIVGLRPLENADSEFASPIVMTDASWRIGLDNAQAATHDRSTDWSVVGDSYSKTTTANGREMVNL